MQQVSCGDIGMAFFTHGMDASAGFKLSIEFAVKSRAPCDEKIYTLYPVGYRKRSHAAAQQDGGEMSRLSAELARTSSPKTR